MAGETFCTPLDPFQQIVNVHWEGKALIHLSTNSATTVVLKQEGAELLVSQQGGYVIKCKPSQRNLATGELEPVFTVNLVPTTFGAPAAHTYTIVLIGGPFYPGETVGHALVTDGTTTGWIVLGNWQDYSEGDSITIGGGDDALSGLFATIYAPPSEYDTIQSDAIPPPFPLVEATDPITGIIKNSDPNLIGLVRIVFTSGHLSSFPSPDFEPPISYPAQNIDKAAIEGPVNFYLQKRVYLEQRTADGVAQTRMLELWPGGVGGGYVYAVDYYRRRLIDPKTRVQEKTRYGEITADDPNRLLPWSGIDFGTPYPILDEELPERTGEFDS